MNHQIGDYESKDLTVEKIENKYHDLYNSVKEGLVLLDEDGNFKECNKAFTIITGYTVQELKTTIFLDKIFKNWETAYQNIAKQVYKKGNSEEFERELNCKDGKTIIVTIEGSISNKNFMNLDIWVLVHDISYKKKLEREIIENEQKYHLLFESLDVSIFISDGKTRKILDVNSHLIETFGYTKTELLNMKIESLSMEPLSTINMTNEILNGKIKQIPVQWYLRKNNSPVPLAITLGTYLWEGRKIICGIARDITEYINENIKKTNLINKINELHIDITDFIEILKTNYMNQPTMSLLNYGITEKELHVIFLITQGLSNKEIADKLHTAEVTVKKHISSIFQKLKLKKRTELMSFIINKNIKL